jgi:hypothetical protein
MFLLGECTVVFAWAKINEPVSTKIAVTTSFLNSITIGFS